MEKIVGKANLEFFTELFETLDADNSGVLDKKELKMAIELSTPAPD